MQSSNSTTEMNAWVESVLGMKISAMASGPGEPVHTSSNVPDAEPAPGKPAATPAATPSASPDAAVLDEARETISYIANAIPDLAESPDEPDFVKRLAEARKAFQVKDAGKLAPLLEALRADIVKAVGRARADEAAAVSRGSVERATMALDIRRAHADALANLEKMGAKLIAMPGVKGDPRLPQVQKALVKLKTLIPPIDKSLDEALDRFDKAETRTARQAVSKDVVVSLKAYQAKLLADPALQRLEVFAQTELGAEIAQQFRAVLDETETGVQAA